MAKPVKIVLEMPADLAKFRMPKGLHRRLHDLLDKQDRGEKLSAAERREAEGLVEMSELLTLLRLRAERASPRVS